MMSDKTELIKERDRLFIKSQHLGQDKERLEKENENLSMSIKGMASAKVNLDKSYQDLEGLYGRLEKENAALVKRWADLGEWVKFYKGTGSGNEFYRGTIKCKMNELEKLKQAGSK